MWCVNVLAEVVCISQRPLISFPISLSHTTPSHSSLVPGHKDRTSGPSGAARRKRGTILGVWVPECLNAVNGKQPVTYSTPRRDAPLPEISCINSKSLNSQVSILCGASRVRVRLVWGWNTLRAESPTAGKTPGGQFRQDLR